MFLFYSSPLCRVQENVTSLNILIRINISKFNSLLHPQCHSLHHFRLNVHQGFLILHVTIYSKNNIGKTISWKNILNRLDISVKVPPML